MQSPPPAPQLEPETTVDNAASIVDEALAQVVRAARRREVHPVRLDASDLGVQRLVGLESLATVEVLLLSGNKIEDLSPLAGLSRLRVLDLAGNRITQVDSLAPLGNLTHLDLASNRIVDVTPLAALQQLVWLSLAANPVGDLSALTGLEKLASLDLTATMLDSTAREIVQQLRQAGLEVTADPITMAPEAAPASAPVLFVEAVVEAAVRTVTGIRDAPLAAEDLSAVTELEVAIPVVDGDGDSLGSATWDQPRLSLADLPNLPHLRSLRVYYYKIADLSPLADLDELRDLSLQWTGIEDIEALANMPFLRHLSMIGNHVADLRPLASVRSLTVVALPLNAVTDISPLGGLPDLLQVDLSNPPEWVYAPVAHIGISKNAVADLSGLATAQRLQRLTLQRNFVVDLSPIAGLPNLSLVNISDNPLSNASLMIVADLEARGVLVAH